MFRRSILGAALLALAGGLATAAAPPPKARFASLPRTTALMLALDHAHRAKNPLGR